MPDYLEGDLDLTKRALLDAHLDACGDCSREFAEMRRTIALLRGLPSPEPPALLVENVMRRIRAGEGELHFGARLREWIASLATPRIALPATALALGLLMATGNLDPGILSVSDRDPRAASEQAPALEIARLSEAAIDSSLEDPALVIGRPQPLAVSGRPPAVAQVPRITITLPGDASTGVFVQRRAQRSIRSTVPPLPGSSPGLSTFVANRFGPEMAGAQASSFAAPVDVKGLSPEERRSRELDERLLRLIEAPAAFSAEFVAYSVAEQELWLTALAERAKETGRAEEALAELRLSGDRSALQLATAFSVELKRVGSGRDR
jgi:anti-sigma factor RsiW